MNERVETVAGPEDRRGLSTVTVLAFFAIGLLAVVQIVGAFLPWGTGSVLFISQTVDGFDLDGEYTLAVASSVLVVLAAALAFRPDQRLTFGYAMLAGFANIGICVWQRTKLETYGFEFGPIAVEITPETSAEEGILMTMGGAAAMVLISGAMIGWWYWKRRAEAE